MKTFILPPPFKVPKGITVNGEFTLAAFITELILPRPGWRERGKAALLLEISAALDTAGPGAEVKWSDEAHEQLLKEVAMQDVQVRPELTRVVAQVQELLYSAS